MPFIRITQCRNMDRAGESPDIRRFDTLLNTDCIVEILRSGSDSALVYLSRGGRTLIHAMHGLDEIEQKIADACRQDYAAFLEETKAVEESGGNIWAAHDPDRKQKRKRK